MEKIYKIRDQQPIRELMAEIQDEVRVELLKLFERDGLLWRWSRTRWRRSTRSGTRKMVSTTSGQKDT